MKPAFPYIIAEIASAHEGNHALCAKLIELSASTGADAVKLQIFHRDTLISRVHPKFDSFGEIEIQPEIWAELLDHAARTGLDVIVEVFDETSLGVAEASGVVSAYKLPTSDIGNPDLLRPIAETGKTVMLGVGGARDAEVADAVRILQSAGTSRIILMHGFQAYPTKIEDTRLARLRSLASDTGLDVGYADHADAGDAELARLLPAMALGAGAIVIEKHITDDRSRKGRDHYSALNPDEFADFVSLMRRTGEAIGGFDDALTPAEMTYRREMKRYAVAASGLEKGQTCGSADVAFKRTNTDGISHAEIGKIEGGSLKVSKQADDPLATDDFL